MVSVVGIGKNDDDEGRNENGTWNQQPVKRSQPTARRLHFDPTPALAGTVQRRRSRNGRSAAVVRDVDVGANDKRENVGQYQHVEHVLPASRRYDASQQRTEGSSYTTRNNTNSITPTK